YALYLGTGLEYLGVLMALLGLLIGLLIPFWGSVTISPRMKWVLIGGSGLAATCLLAIGVLTGGESADNPRPNSLLYALNADTNAAIWVTTDQAPDRWTSQFLTSEARPSDISQFIPFATNQLLNSPAPKSELQAPSITSLEDKVIDGVRRLQLRINTPRQGEMIEVVTGKETEILSASIDAKNIKLSEHRLWLWYFAPPPEGIKLLLELNASQPLTIKLVDYTHDIKQSTGIPIKERPEDLMPVGNWFQDIAAVCKSYTFQSLFLTLDR